MIARAGLSVHQIAEFAPEACRVLPAVPDAWSILAGPVLPKLSFASKIDPNKPKLLLSRSSTCD